MHLKRCFFRKFGPKLVGRIVLKFTLFNPELLQTNESVLENKTSNIYKRNVYCNSDKGKILKHLLVKYQKLQKQVWGRKLMKPFNIKEKWMSWNLLWFTLFSHLIFNFFLFNDKRLQRICGVQSKETCIYGVWSEETCMYGVWRRSEERII